MSPDLNEVNASGTGPLPYASNRSRRIVWTIMGLPAPWDLFVDEFTGAFYEMIENQRYSVPEVYLDD